MKATPLSAVPALGLVSVNVSVVVPFTTMLAAPNALAIVGGATAGGATTTRNATAVPPVPLSVEVTGLVVLLLRPPVVALTSTVTVQVPLAAMVPPEKLSEVSPAIGAKVGEPQPVVGGVGSRRHFEAGRERVGEGDAGQRGRRVRDWSA